MIIYLSCLISIYYLLFLTPLIIIVIAINRKFKCSTKNKLSINELFVL